MAIGFTAHDLKRCKYDDLLRLADILGLSVGIAPSLGSLAAAVAKAMVQQGGVPSPPVRTVR